MIIRKHRELAGLTQAEAAKKLDISVDSIRRYESGEREPRASDLMRMAQLFGCSIDDLVKSESTE